MEQALLLPKDMANLKSMGKYEVFLDLKRELAMVSPLNPSFLLFFLFLLIIFLFLIATFSSFVKCSSPWLAIQTTYRAEEMVDYSHYQMKEEEGRWIVAMDAFQVVKKSNQELKSMLTKAEREKRSVEVTLDSVERQVEGQRVLLRQVEDQLAASKKQIAALKKKMEEVKKAKDKVKQDGYDIEVA